MQIYRVTAELLDYVFYATTERGKVYETGPFLHNYALTYALGLVQSETYVYTYRIQEPHYEEELTPLNGKVYLTPAAPLEVGYRLVQWNTLRESYGLPPKPQSVGYPDWGFARMLRPGSRFVFYLLVLVASPRDLPPSPALQDLLVGQLVRVRLGKFLAKVRLQAEAAAEVTQGRGDFAADLLLNWRDLEPDPVVCDVVTTGRPTRLIARARFADEPYYRARFANGEIHLPVRMRYLARPPESRRRKSPADAGGGLGTTD